MSVVQTIIFTTEMVLSKADTIISAFIVSSVQSHFFQGLAPEWKIPSRTLHNSGQPPYHRVWF